MASCSRTLALAACAALLLGCRDAATPETAPDPAAVHLGLLGILGRAADTDDYASAALLAASEINQAGGVNGQPLQVLVNADLPGALGGPIGARTLVAQGCVGIVGPAYSSSVVTTYEQVTGPAGIPLCSYAATSPVLSTLPGAGDLIWRTVPSDALQGVVLAEQTRTLGVSSVAVMYRDDIYGDALAATFQARYQSLGGTITTSVAFPPDQTSGHGATVDQALAPGVPSAILIVGAELESADLLLQLQLANPQPKPVLLGVDALYGPTFLANAPQAYLEGMYGTTNDTPVGEPDYDLFAAAYQARAGTLPSPGLEGAYDAVYLMALAMAQDGANTSEAIRTHLRAVSGGLGGAATAIHPGQFAAGLQAIQAGLPINYQGASGPIDFDAHGDVTSATYLWWRVTGDQFVTVATIQVP